MKLIDTDNFKGLVKASELSEWLLSHGISALTTSDVADLLGVPAGQVRQRLAKAKGRGQFVTPARGFWVPVPAERMAWGAPEPAAYLDAMMRFLDSSYYVGWLTAAALQGASHQASQVFQVAVGKHVADREIGRARFNFYNRSRIEALPKERTVTSSGVFISSTCGVTMLDVMHDIQQAGGLDNAATVVVELADSGKPFMDDVLAAARLYPDATLRRLGWVLDNFAVVPGLDALEQAAQGSVRHPSLLSPFHARAGAVDERWRIVMNREVEPDV